MGIAKKAKTKPAAKAAGHERVRLASKDRDAFLESLFGSTLEGEKSKKKPMKRKKS